MTKQTKIVIGLICFFAVTLWLLSRTQDGAEPSDSKPRHTNDAINDNGFCLGGCPVSVTSTDVLIIHHILELSNNPDTKFADWVAYRIIPETIGMKCKRTWKRDPDLDPATTLSPIDYKNIRAALQSDRGHQAPLDSLCGSTYWEELDYLSNITPQKSALNEGEWEHLENAERKLIERNYTGAVSTVTGPLYERDMPSLPNAHLNHKVPSGYWKIVSINSGNQIEAVGFVMQQDAARDADYCGDEKNIGEIAVRAHLTFFPNIPAESRTNIYKSNSRKLFAELGCVP